MTERHDDGHSDEQETSNKVIKRRGILAAAGAAMATLMAKQAAQPVNAATGSIGTIGFYALPGNTSPVASNFPPSATFGLAGSTGVDFGASIAGSARQVGVYGFSGATNGFGMMGINASDSGFGVCGFFSDNGHAVIGGGGNGVIGEILSGTLSDGCVAVHGVNTSTGSSQFGVLGVVGAGAQDGFGVVGRCLTSLSSIGVQGEGKTVGVVGKATASSAVGVMGLTNGLAVNSATLGGTVGVSNQASLPGVNGKNVAGGIGTQGQSDTAGGTGVRGDSASGFPIIGNVGGSANTAAGVLGAGTKGPGVQGQSTSGHGLVGTTSATDGHAGLIGNASAAGGIGLMGIAPGFGTASVGTAGEFFGNVKVHGAVTSPTVQAVAANPTDGTYRALHGVASPDALFEDFGRATLAGGRVDVKLDAEFAALIHTDDYHVFAMPEGPLHLHVMQKTAAGFTVVGTPLAGTTGGGLARPEVAAGTFSYRVVAKRKDMAGARLAKVAGPPTAGRPAPFAVPETPQGQEPAKQP